MNILGVAFLGVAIVLAVFSMILAYFEEIENIVHHSARSTYLQYSKDIDDLQLSLKQQEKELIMIKLLLKDLLDGQQSNTTSITKDSDS